MVGVLMRMSVHRHALLFVINAVVLLSFVSLCDQLWVHYCLSSRQLGLSSRALSWLAAFGSRTGVVLWSVGTPIFLQRRGRALLSVGVGGCRVGIRCPVLVFFGFGGSAATTSVVRHVPSSSHLLHGFVPGSGIVVAYHGFRGALKTLCMSSRANYVLRAAWLGQTTENIWFLTVSLRDIALKVYK